jgi:tripartite-type tricarboxylate transporter receptor subunit TctC
MSAVRHALILSLLAAGTAAAQQYPTRGIRIVTPFPAASVTDVLARPIAQKLSEAWGQSVVVDNRAGAGGIIGAEMVAKAAPDGYTLLLGTNGTNAINQSLYAKLPYDADKSFAPVTIVTNSYLLLVVHPSVPVKSVKDLVALAKAKPGQLTFGSGGSGTTPHLAGELFRAMANVEIVHVPYKGSPQSTLDLLAGRISMIFASAATSLPHARVGKLRVVAMSGAKRDPGLADVPTISESGVPGFEAEPWFGVFAPAGTPAPIVKQLSTEIGRIVALPDVKGQYETLGMAATSSTPEAFQAYVRTEIAKWGKVVKAAKAQAE